MTIQPIAQLIFQERKRCIIPLIFYTFQHMSHRKLDILIEVTRKGWIRLQGVLYLCKKINHHQTSSMSTVGSAQAATAFENTANLEKGCWDSRRLEFIIGEIWVLLSPCPTHFEVPYCNLMTSKCNLNVGGSFSIQYSGYTMPSASTNSKVGNLTCVQFLEEGLCNLYSSQTTYWNETIMHLECQLKIKQEAFNFAQMLQIQPYG